MGTGPATAGDIVVGGSGDFAAGAPTALTAAEILSTGANAGTLDPQFGTASTAGFVTTSVPNMQSNGQAQGVAALPNGNVAVAGYQGTSAVVAEWGPTGTPDGSFGPIANPGLEVGGGVVRWNSLVYEPVGDFLITAGTEGATGSSTSMIVGEYSGTTGAPNTHFASSGVVAASPSGLSAGLNAIAVQPDGKAVGAGQVPTGLGAGNVTEVGLMRVMGPTVSVANPPIAKVTATGNTTVNFTVSVDEPLSNGRDGVGLRFDGDFGRRGLAVWHGSISASSTVPRQLRCRSSAHQYHARSLPDGELGSHGERWTVREHDAVDCVGHHPAHPASIADHPDEPLHLGYWLVNHGGLVYTYGTAKSHGSTTGKPTTPIVGMAATPSGAGTGCSSPTGRSWPTESPAAARPAHLKLKVPVRRDRRRSPPATVTGWSHPTEPYTATATLVLRYGATHSAGRRPIVGIAATPDGLGYWLVSSTGAVFRLWRRWQLRRRP